MKLSSENQKQSGRALAALRGSSPRKVSSAGARSEEKVMTLESKLEQMIPSHWKDGIEVTAFELTHDGESWSVNTPFNIGSGLDRESAIQRLRSRWEIFKANYESKARVKDLSDISDEETVCNLEVNCTAFADVRIAA